MVFGGDKGVAGKLIGDFIATSEIIGLIMLKFGDTGDTSESSTLPTFKGVFGEIGGTG